MNNKEFAAKCKEIATNYKTLYVLGGFGAPLTAASKKRWIEAYAYNAQTNRKNKILAATADTFAFDCVGLIKGILWGWDGNKKAVYGGAKYLSNAVPDIGADTMIKRCNEISTDFTKVEIGEALWTSGHIGVYIGDGLAVECTPKWYDCVQITAVEGMHDYTNAYNFRQWKKHGKLPYFDYISETPKKSIDEIANEVIAGKWGNYPERKDRLIEAGYDYDAVQKRVDEIWAAINVIVGDIDGDKKVTSADARLVLRAVLGLENLSELQNVAADYDKDGKVTLADARAILRKAVGLEDK